MQVSLPVWWSMIVLMAFAMGLAGCDSPSVAFQSVAERRVKVDGFHFSVRATRYEAEAIRLGLERPPRRADVVYKGAKAMVIASGCEVVPKSLEGDENIVRADLECPGGGPKPWSLRKKASLDCGFTTPWQEDYFGNVAADFECQVLD